MMRQLDLADKQILNLIQQDFPVTSRPYRELGNSLGFTEEEAFKRVTKLREDGFIRRLGGVFDSKKLGYVSTLCAVAIPEDSIDIAAKLINQYPGVTHHYLRDHHYNLWFTLIVSSRPLLEQTIREIKCQLREEASADSLLNLPAKRTFKIKVQFKV